MDKKIPMTKEGYAQLLEEMKELKEERLPKILREVQVAREQGDLSENAEYKFGKEAQRNIERQIGEINYKLSCAEIIDISSREGEAVIFGATVTFLNTDTNEKNTYKIVGEDEANLDLGKISYKAPLVQAAIGKEPGDKVKLKTANGVMNLEIDEVVYK